MGTGLESRLQEVMEAAVENQEVAGVSLLAEKDGREVIYCEAGMADRESGRKMSRDAIFRLYSQTKPITAAAAMILMERGQLDLCQPVAELLPAFAGQRAGGDGGVVPAARPMLVYDLLRMTSGLVYPDNPTEAGRAVEQVYGEACARLHTEHPMTTREFADRLGACPLSFAPGSSWAYGTSADVLGAVIEQVAGCRLSEFMAEEIFRPLGMEDTAFWVPEEKRSRLAAAYEEVSREDGFHELRLYTGDNLAVRNDMAEAPAYEAGGAGLASTLDDYLQFARMLLAGGAYNGRQILRPETVRYLTQGELMDHQQRVFQQWIGLEGFSYGNLMRVCRYPSRSSVFARAGEYGWDGWLGMYFANFPKEQMTILVGMQRKDSGTIHLTRKLRNILLSSLC